MRIRVLAILAAMVFIIGLIPAGMAENGYIEIEARELTLNRYSDRFIYRPKDSDYYGLIDAYGNQIVAPKYSSMSTVSQVPYFKVSVPVADGIHGNGLIDADGNILVPPHYSEVNVISDRWATGITLTPSNADDKDITYTNWSSNRKLFFRIDTVDFYFRGELVGTLPRSEYDGSPSAYGDYICVTSRNKNRNYYNNRMEKSPVKKDASGEYTSTYKDGKNTYIHNGSGQTAFAPGCTLTADEVVKAYQYEQKQMINLQGEVIFTPAQEYTSIYSFSGGYAEVYLDGKRGLIDQTGKEILPLEYDDIGNSEAYPFRYGCISAVKDGKFGFVNADNQATCEFKYPSDVVSNRGTFASIKNLDGTYIVLSGMAGELPEHYPEVNFASNAPAFEARNDRGEIALINIYGEPLIPFMEMSSLNYNNDVSAASVYMGSYVYRIYHFDDPTVHQDRPLTAPGSGDTWTCENGHSGNTGKFCPECGAARPGSGTDNVPNYCPECGTKLK